MTVVNGTTNNNIFSRSDSKFQVQNISGSCDLQGEFCKNTLHGYSICKIVIPNEWSNQLESGFNERGW